MWNETGQFSRSKFFLMFKPRSSFAIKPDLRVTPAARFSRSQIPFTVLNISILINQENHLPQGIKRLKTNARD